MPTLKMKPDGGGFFSYCTVTLADLISYFNIYKKLPELDRSEIYRGYKKTNQATEFFSYNNLQPLTGNVSRFSAFSMLYGVAESPDESIPEINACDKYFDGWGANIFAVSEYKNIQYDCLKDILYKFFDPADDIKKLKKDIINKYAIDTDKTIAVYYRGTCKKIELDLPTYDSYFYKIEQLKKDNPEYKILIQSDELEFIAEAKKEFPSCIVIAEDKVKGNKLSSPFWYLNNDTYSYHVFFAIVLLLADCRHIILNTCNVGLWICLYRGHKEGIIQHLNNSPKFINIPSGVENPFYDVNRDVWV